MGLESRCTETWATGRRYRPLGTKIEPLRSSLEWVGIIGRYGHISQFNEYPRRAGVL